MRLVLIGCLLGFGVPLRAGTLVTRQGTTHSGEVLFEGEQLVVRSPRGKAGPFKLDQVKEVSFGKEVVAEYDNGDEPREKHENRPRNILAEYFSDRELTQRTLMRYETSIFNFWMQRDRPDAAIPPGGAARYTTRIVPKQSGDYLLIVSCNSGVRLWVDGKPKIDMWRKFYSGIRVPVRLEAGKPVHIRLEAMLGDVEFRLSLQWHAPKIGDGYIPAECLQRPDGQPADSAVLQVVAPAAKRHFLGPKSIPLEAQLVSGKIKALEFLANGVVVGVANSPPYRAIWTDPEAGYYRVIAKGTDANGFAWYSTPVEVSVSGRGGEESLPSPWGEQTISEKRLTGRGGSAWFKNGEFHLARGGGLILEKHESVHFVCQPVSADFTLTARLKSLTPADPLAGPVAGLMVRDDLRTQTKASAVVTGLESTNFLQRSDSWMPPGAVERNMIAPCWLRLMRHGNRVRAYCSKDGQTWTAMGSSKVEMRGEVMVGLCAMTRLEDKPCEAVFDNLTLTVGSPPMTTSTPGLMLRDGTFMACHVHGIRDNAVLYDRLGKERIPMRIEKVAWMVYQPMLAELVEKLPQDRAGVLLSSGDFLEGEIKEANYRVVVSTVLFGNRTVPVRGEVAAICLQKPQAANGYSVVAADGSIFRCVGVPRIEDGSCKFDVTTLGAISLPVKDLAKIRNE